MTKRHVGAMQLIVVFAMVFILAWIVYWLLRKPFVFANIQEGQQLSGHQTIVASQNGGTSSSLTLWLDGKHYQDSPMHQEADHWYSDVSLRTSAYANGPHMLEIRIGRHVFDERHVVFRNAKYFR